MIRALSSTISTISTFIPNVPTISNRSIIISSLTMISTYLIYLITTKHLFPSPRPPPNESYPIQKARTRMYWFTMIVLVGPVWLLTPISYLVVGWAMTAWINAKDGSGEGGIVHWPEEGGQARIWANVGLGWAVIEVSLICLMTGLAGNVKDSNQGAQRR